MPNLQRLTTEYIKIEDRIRVCGEISQNTTVTMWLTRPLLNLFLPHLFKIAEKNTPNKVVQQVSAPMAGIVQQFAQEKAISNLIPTPAIKPLQQNIEQFIETVEITANDKLATVRFKARNELDAEPVTVSFDADQLRQWLHILYKCYGQSEWGINNWPAWIDVSAPVGVTPTTSH